MEDVGDAMEAEVWGIGLILYGKLNARFLNINPG